ncbi:MAG TPA: cytochrome c [Saprospiraceae bacterium]|nr:cytochrome c [Saprospiraceae bacterium]
MKRGRMYNKLFSTWVLIILISAVFLGVSGCGTYLPAIDAARIQAGQHVYEQYNCLQCHGYDGNDKMDLKKALHKKGLDELKAWILDPGQFKPGTEMPSYGGVLSDRELEDVIQYLRVLANQGR